MYPHFSYRSPLLDQLSRTLGTWKKKIYIYSVFLFHRLTGNMSFSLDYLIPSPPFSSYTFLFIYLVIYFMVRMSLMMLACVPFSFFLFFLVLFSSISKKSWPLIKVCEPLATFFNMGSSVPSSLVNLNVLVCCVKLYV